MSNTVFTDLVYHICELYIDNVHIHGENPTTFLANDRKVFARLRKFNVSVNPKKTKLGLEEVKYVGRVVSVIGISFTPEKRLKVLNFPAPKHKKHFYSLSDSPTSHDGDGQASREMIPIRKYIGGSPLQWTPESIAAFERCQQAIFNYQELYFLEDTVTPSCRQTPQTTASVATSSQSPTARSV